MKTARKLTYYIIRHSVVYKTELFHFWVVCSNYAAAGPSGFQKRPGVRRRFKVDALPRSVDPRIDTAYKFKSLSTAKRIAGREIADAISPSASYVFKVVANVDWSDDLEVQDIISTDIVDRKFAGFDNQPTLAILVSEMLDRERL